MRSMSTLIATVVLALGVLFGWVTASVQLAPAFAQDKPSKTDGTVGLCRGLLVLSEHRGQPAGRCQPAKYATDGEHRRDDKSRCTSHDESSFASC